MKKEKLFEKFPPVTTKEWLDKINADLKGADFTKKLVWKTAEGLEVMPFYRTEDIDNLEFIDVLPGQFPFVRGTKIKNNNWLIRQNIRVADYTEANRKALDILMKGVDSLGFVIGDPDSLNPDNLRTLLHNIQLESVELNFLSNGKAKEILDILIRIATDQGMDLSLFRGAIEADPLGRLMVNGTLCIPEAAGFDYLAALTSASSVLPALKTVHLNASHFGNAGSDIVQELAFGIAMGSEYLSQLGDRGLDAGYAASKIRFSFGIGSDYFPEIARLRAARWLWSAVVERYIPGRGQEIPMNIHSVTSRWNKTLFDPHVNMLRTQTEAMSAILGGADSLTVEPFDVAFRPSDEFSERIARNQQLLLKEESYFDKVADPAAGSYYIENLTSLIATKAWELFVDIEGKGGFLAALRSGYIQSLLSQAAEKRKKEVASRKRTFVGTNQFPTADEKIPSGTDTDIAFRKRDEQSDMVVTPIDLFRGAEEFESIRIAVERSGKRPSVFLLPLGNTAMRRARAQFASGFFGCAGYKVTDNNGFTTAAEGIESFLKSGADIIVICSSDDEYMTYGPEVYSALKDKAIIVVAGNPASADELKALGLELFIHIKSDVPGMLKAFNGMLGIRQ